MKKAKVQALLEREKKAACAEGYAEGSRYAREQYRREYERVVALPKLERGDRRPLVIGQEPQERYHRFLLAPDVPFQLSRDLAYRSALSADEVVFRAVRQCYQLHTGHVVHWWTWELAR